MLPKSNGDRAPDPGATGRFTRAVGAARDWARTRGSALRRRIIIFNLIALNSLVLGVLYLGGSQDTLLRHRADTLLHSAILMSDLVAARMPGIGPQEAGVADILNDLKPIAGTELWLFDRSGRLLARGQGDTATALPRSGPSATPMMDGINRIGEWLTASVRARTAPGTPRDPEQAARDLVAPAIAEGPHLSSPPDSRLWAAAPVGEGGTRRRFWCFQRRRTCWTGSSGWSKSACCGSS